MGVSPRVDRPACAGGARAGYYPAPRDTRSARPAPAPASPSPSRPRSPAARRRAGVRRRRGRRRRHLRRALPAVRPAAEPRIRQPAAATTTGGAAAGGGARRSGVREAGCITMTDDLAGMETVAAPPVADGGAAIAPTSLHAGVVTSMADDATRTRLLRRPRACRARSVGSAPLGRRIYLGPFATQGALDEAPRPRARAPASPRPIRRRSDAPRSLLAAPRRASPRCAAPRRRARPGGLPAALRRLRHRRLALPAATPRFNDDGGVSCRAALSPADAALRHERLPDPLRATSTACRRSPRGCSPSPDRRQRPGDPRRRRCISASSPASATRPGPPQFFRGLGYRSRGVGADGLGRRIYIGPFTSQGALDQALADRPRGRLHRPYPAKHTKF